MTRSEYRCALAAYCRALRRYARTAEPPAEPIGKAAWRACRAMDAATSEQVKRIQRAIYR